MPTWKNQFIVLPGGADIVDVCVVMLGKTSDINLFRENRHKFTETQKFLGDQAYIGDDAITTPHKKRKNLEISASQKQENKQLSSRRIAVEHMICRVKIFRVASDTFRLARHRYHQVIMAVCGLVRLRLNRLFPLTGLKQISSPNEAQTSFISEEYVSIVVQPLYKTKRHRCAKRL